MQTVLFPAHAHTLCAGNLWRWQEIWSEIHALSMLWFQLLNGKQYIFFKRGKQNIYCICILSFCWRKKIKQDFIFYHGKKLSARTWQETEISCHIQKFPNKKEVFTTQKVVYCTEKRQEYISCKGMETKYPLYLHICILIRENNSCSRNKLSVVRSKKIPVWIW